jgi:serralysin
MPSPTGWSQTSAVPDSGDRYIDSLVDGRKWGGGRGTGATITFSFPNPGYWSTDPFSGYGSSFGNQEPWNIYYEPLSASDKTYFRTAVSKWADVANIRITEVTETSSRVGDIRAAYSWLPDTADSSAWAYSPLNTSFAGDIWFNSLGSPAFEVWSPGTFSHYGALHELGHALGLKHPFDGSPRLPQSVDSGSFTIMSYSAEPGNESTIFSFYPTTPMPLDIAAIQYIYGANRSHNSGNNTHHYSDSKRYHETIWDAGGTDNLTYGGNRDCSIDLRGGYGSTIGQPVYVQSIGGRNLYAINNVWIAYDAVIENGSGGSGDDLLTGNQVGNVLNGNGGNDLLVGLGGADRLLGGAGSDILAWDSRDFLCHGGTGIDTLSAGTLNLTRVANGIIKDVEQIDLSGGGRNRLTLNATDILDLSSSTNTLLVLGDAGDSIDIVGSFSNQGTSGGFRYFKVGNALLAVDLDISSVA